MKHVRGTWLHRRLGDRLFVQEIWQPERNRFAAGCAIGSFFSMIPLPFQMIASALIAFFARVNIPAAIACTWISNPLTAAFFLYIQYKVGAFILGLPANEPGGKFLDILKHAPLPVLTGSVVVGVVLSIISYPVALIGWDYVTRHFLKPVRRGGSKSREP